VVANFKETANMPHIGNEEHPIEFYDDFVVRNISDRVPEDMGLAWAQMGLTAELGEFVEVYEKALRKRGELLNSDYDKMKDELGDVLWYLTACAFYLGTDLTELIYENTHKLKARGNV